MHRPFTLLILLVCFFLFQSFFSLNQGQNSSRQKEFFFLEKVFCLHVLSIFKDVLYVFSRNKWFWDSMLQLRIAYFLSGLSFLLLTVFCFFTD